MRKLQPLEADHSKLKEGFRKVLRNQPFVAKWFRSLFAQCHGFPLKLHAAMEAKHHKMEVHFVKVLNQLVAMKKFRSPSCASAKSRRPHFHLRNGPEASRQLCTDSFRSFLLIFLCLNFHFLLVFSHSCNSLARKYPRKGKLPSYINSLVNTKKGLSGSFLQETNLCIFYTQ